MATFWHKINKPITILAPMDDVTDFVFREITATIAKPDVLFTEFTSANALFSAGREKVLKKLYYSEAQRPIVAQLWGAKPENYKLASKLIEELGFDGIDINMGCPDKNIMKNNSGAALVNNKQLVGDIISAIHEGAPKLPLSIKTRLDVTQDLTKDWLSFLLSQNIDALILHGRNSAQTSRDPAGWDEIGKAVDLKNKLNPKIIFIGNGDVKSYAEIIEKHKLYKVDGVMVGRGIFQNPWLFEKNENAAEHSKEEYLEVLLKHTKLYKEKWGSEKNFQIMKKFFKVYINGFRGANELRQKLMETNSYEDVYVIMDSLGKTT